MNAAVRLLLVAGLIVHPGGLDSKGGHHDRRSGTYHYHSSPASAPAIPPPTLGLSVEATVKEAYRREARTTARTETRVEARVDPPRQKKTQSVSVATQEHEYRTWSDVSGKFTVIARFAGYTGGRLRLVKQDGSEINLDVEVLSDADKTYVRSILSKSGVRPSF